MRDGIQVHLDTKRIMNWLFLWCRVYHQKCSYHAHRWETHGVIDECKEKSRMSFCMNCDFTFLNSGGLKVTHLLQPCKIIFHVKSIVEKPINRILVVAKYVKTSICICHTCNKYCSAGNSTKIHYENGHESLSQWSLKIFLWKKSLQESSNLMIWCSFSCVYCGKTSRLWLNVVLHTEVDHFKIRVWV